MRYINSYELSQFYDSFVKYNRIYCFSVIILIYYKKLYFDTN